MTWHAEPITLTLRRLEAGDSYDARDPFASVATAQLLGGKKAYVSGFLNDGTKGRIRKADWIELCALLHDQYGILEVESERHTVEKTFDTRPAPLT